MSDNDNDFSNDNDTSTDTSSDSPDLETSGESVSSVTPDSIEPAASTSNDRIEYDANPVTGNSPQNNVPIQQGSSKKILWIILIILGILALCCIVIFGLLFFVGKSAVDSVDEMAPIAPAEDIVSTDVPFGQPVSTEDWEVKVVRAEKVEDQVLVTLSVENKSLDAVNTFSSLLMLKLKNNTKIYAEDDFGYSPDYFADVEGVDGDIDPGNIVEGQVVYTIDDEASIDDMYLSFTPDIFGTEQYRLMLK